jgi:hypothetical protein
MKRTIKYSFMAIGFMVGVASSSAVGIFLILFVRHLDWINYDQSLAIMYFMYGIFFFVMTSVGYLMFKFGREILVLVVLGLFLSSCAPDTGLKLVKGVHVKANTGCKAADAKRTYKYRGR